MGLRRCIRDPVCLDWNGKGEAQLAESGLESELILHKSTRRSREKTEATQPSHIYIFQAGI